MSNMIMRCGALLSALALLGGCSINPATGERQFTAFMSPAQEQQIGDQQHEQIIAEFGSVYDDPRLAAYIDRIGQELASYGELPELTYTFTVLDTDIVNAFALPGGYVYVTRGLLTIGYDEAEIAGVIAHEIGHITARHSAARYSRTVLAQLGGAVLGIAVDNDLANSLYGAGAMALVQSYSRSQEYEADSLGVRYLARAGYDPLAMADFLGTLEAYTELQAALSGNPEAAQQFSIYATHPRTARRVVEAIERAEAESGDSMVGGARNRDAYLAAVDGMSYGGSREQGFVKERVFIHPELAFRFDAPTGFELNNGASQVIGLGPDETVMAFDMAPRENAGDMRSYIRSVWARELSPRSVQAGSIDGLPAATAMIRLSGQDVLLVAIDSGRDGLVYRFQYRAPPSVMSRRNSDFLASAGSFRRLSASEARNAQPWRIDIRTVREGDSVASLARDLPFDAFQEAHFRVLNGMSNGEDLTPGMKIKMIR